MSLDPAISQNVVNGLEQAYEAGRLQGLQEADAAYFGKSARVLTGGLFAASLQAASSGLRQHDPEAADFFAEKAGEFQAWVTPPKVQTTEPPDGATGVVTGNAISVKFVTPGLRADSVTDEHFYVIPASGGPHLLGDLSYDETTCTINFAPTNPLSPNTAYTVTLDAGLVAAGGMTLGTPVTFGFTTGDA